MATLEFALKFVTNSENAFATASLSQHPNHVGASCRIRTNDPEITNHVLWPTELKRQRHLCAVTVVKRVQMYCFFLNYKTFSTFFSKNRRKISFFRSKHPQKQGKTVMEEPDCQQQHSAHLPPICVAKIVKGERRTKQIHLFFIPSRILFSRFSAKIQQTNESPHKQEKQIRIFSNESRRIKAQPKHETCLYIYNNKIRRSSRQAQRHNRQTESRPTQ